MIGKNEEWDAIVIGAGPNGYTCAAYLARAGARTLLLERKFESGGGLATENFGTPFRFNLHATYMMLAELMPPYANLELKDRGAVFIRPEVQAAFLYEDGAPLVFYTDPKKTAESVGRVSPQDGVAFEKMYSELKTMCDEILIPATYAPALPALDQIELLNKSELGRRVVELSEMSPRDIVQSYGFKNERVQAALLYLASMWGVHPDSTGVGYMVAIYIYRMLNAALVKGGTHSLASALSSAYIAAGGKYMDWAEVTKIIVENGTARGVELKDGRRFLARAVVSTLNPEQTFLQLIGKQNIHKDLAASAEKWEWEEWSLFTSHLGIRGDPPDYAAAKFNPDVNRALINVIGIEAIKDLDNHIAAIEKGTLPAIAGHVTCPTLHDALQASPGPYGPLHTLRWESWSPYKLEGKHWDEVKKDYARRCFERLTRYAPNLSKAKILFEFVFSPVDVERRLSTMKNGSIKHGAYTALQMGYLRPNEECSCNKTPIRGLYVAGASVYPGGMVLLGSGYNAARVVAEDLGKTVWWTPPAFVEEARKKGFLP